MSKKTIYKLKEQYNIIIIDEPGKKKPSVIYGFLKDIDHKKDFIIVESSSGLEILNNITIVAIKPHKKKIRRIKK